MPAPLDSAGRVRIWQGQSPVGPAPAQGRGPLRGPPLSSSRGGAAHTHSRWSRSCWTVKIRKSKQTKAITSSLLTSRGDWGQPPMPQHLSDALPSPEATELRSRTPWRAALETSPLQATSSTDPAVAALSPCWVPADPAWRAAPDRQVPAPAQGKPAQRHPVLTGAGRGGPASLERCLLHPEPPSAPGPRSRCPRSPLATASPARAGLQPPTCPFPPPGGWGQPGAVPPFIPSPGRGRAARSHLLSGRSGAELPAAR